MSLYNIVKQSFTKNIKKSPSIIYLACSGGRDSMALLHICYQLQLPIHVIHINHNLQKPSDDWQKLVENFCTTRQIPINSVKIDWQKFNIHNKTTVNEQLARQVRYQSICQIVENNAIIALAHHADDQTETILMNLCQGTGVSGLAGMQALSQQQEFGQTLNLWRPLLTVSRDEISQFVLENHIPYVDDPTNIGENNRRAWLRQHIIPNLKQQFSGLLHNIARTGENMADIKKIVAYQAEQDLKHCQIQQNWTIYQQQLSIKLLKQLPKERCFAVLRLWITGDEKFSPNRQLIEQVFHLIQQKNPEQQTLIQWQGFHIRRYQDNLYLFDKYFSQYCLNFHDKNFVFEFVQLQFSQKITSIRRILPAEKFQRQDKDFHEPFKKICQRLYIPTWERALAWVVLQYEKPLAIWLPSQIIVLH